MNKPLRQLKLMTVGLAILSLLSGCAPEPEIVRYRVPKDRSGLESLRTSSPPFAESESAGQEATQETRMVVAMFEKPEAVWYFKISGPAEQVSASEDQWTSFFQSVKFEDGQPKWTTPDGWTTAGPKPMRHSTLLIGATDPPLELAVSNLPPGQDLLLNINRWRGQIGLQAAREEELADQVSKLKSEHEEFQQFDATGTGPGQMRPPFAGGGRAPIASNDNAPPFTGGSPDSSKLSYEAPEGWTEGRRSAIVHARLSKQREDAEVQISIVEMPADSNPWEPNVKRWAEQVGLASLSTEELDKRTSELVVDGVAGQQVDLIDFDSESTSGTIAGMIKRDGSAWFLKLSGDKKLVDENRDVFKTFLGTLKFK